VAQWEREWQEKQAKEASEVCPFGSNSLVRFANIAQYFSGILLSAFE
jgi:hypothetical protein